MQFALLFVLTLVSMLVPVQVAATNRMTSAVQSPPLAVLIAFMMGSGALFLAWASGLMGRGQASAATTAPWWAWGGGILTATVLTAQTMAMARVGAGAAISLSVAGQLGASVVMDHFGWLGVDRAPANQWRAAGLVLLVGGTALLQKK
jgi:transporter family-2 protein